MSLTQSLVQELTQDLVQGLAEDSETSLMFESTWKTDNPGPSNDSQITIPTESSSIVNATFDWGDGSSDVITAWDDPSLTHTYPAAGNYTVRVNGSLEGFRFNFSGDREKILNIGNWGNLKLGNSGDYFSGCTELEITAKDILNTSEMTTFHRFFNGAAKITTIPNIGLWDTSNVTDMSHVFAGSDFNSPINSWDVSSATTMQEIFFSCNNFNQPLDSWDVSNVVIFTNSFTFCHNFNQPLNSWNTSSCTNASLMFFDCTVFNQPLFSWNVQNITNMLAMFNATNFNQDLSTWNFESATTAGGMFLNCPFDIDNYGKLLNSLAQQNLNNGVPFGTDAQYRIGLPTISRDTLIDDFSWNITDGGQEVDTDFISIWKTDNAGDSNDDQIELPLESDGTYNFNVDWGDGNSDVITVWNQAETTHTYAAAGTYTVRIDGAIEGWRFNNGGDKDKIIQSDNWGTLKPGNNNSYFQGCTQLQIYATNTLDISGTTDMSNAFRECASTLDIPYINTWDFSNVTDMSSAFRLCLALNANFDNIDVSNVTQMQHLFRDCFSYNGSMLNWDVSSVLTAQRMFSDAHAFNNSSVSGFVFSSCTDFSNMFRDIAVFDQDLSSWNVSAGEDFNNMFRNASVFDQDLSSWNVSAGLDFSNMFRNALAFSAIGGINSWNMTNSVDLSGMLRDTPLFDSAITSWNVINVTDMSGMLQDSGFSVTNYDPLLTTWELLALQSNVNFHAGTAQFTAGPPATAKSNIISTFTWTITDGGEA